MKQAILLMTNKSDLHIYITQMIDKLMCATDNKTDYFILYY